MLYRCNIVELQFALALTCHRAELCPHPTDVQLRLDRGSCPTGSASQLHNKNWLQREGSGAEAQQHRHQ